MYRVLTVTSIGRLIKYSTGTIITTYMMANTPSILNDNNNCLRDMNYVDEYSVILYNIFYYVMLC